VYSFETAKTTHTVRSGEKVRTPEMELRGRARTDRHHALVLDGGAAVIDEKAGEELGEQLTASGELTLEAVITTRSGDQSGPARIVSLSKDSGSRNFTLGQQNENLVLRLRTPKTGSNGTRPSAELFAIRPGEATHLVVTYRDGVLTAYRDGEAVTTTRKIRGDFSNWDKHRLIFGDELSGGRNWNGTLEGVAIYSRALSAGEVAEQWQATKARLATREKVKAVRVRAKVVAVGKTPTLKDIAPYRSALIACEVEVVKNLSGGKPKAGSRIRVVDWAILNGKAQPAGRLRKGQELTLTLEPFAGQEQLESVYLADDLPEDLDAVYYYRVER
jgi:hypothetical protein